MYIITQTLSPLYSLSQTNVKWSCGLPQEKVFQEAMNLLSSKQLLLVHRIGVMSWEIVKNAP